VLKETKKSATKAQVKLGRRKSFRESIAEVLHCQEGVNSMEKAEADVSGGWDTTRMGREIHFGVGADLLVYTTISNQCSPKAGYSFARTFERNHQAML
jgi:hypothetical protein